MKKPLRLIILILGTFIYLQCGSQNWSGKKLEELETSFHSKNYFLLKDRLKRGPSSDMPVVLYYKAAVESAFNNPGESIQYLNQIASIDLIPDTLLTDIWAMKINNYLRLHAYSDALHAADSVLQIADLPKEKENDIRNARRIAAALRDIPPQSITKSGDSELKLKGTHIDVTINSHQRDYAYDTGANYSILMKSEAEALDLQIIEAGIDVGTATGKRVKGDVGVAESLSIGNMTFEHVVFLVFPDEALTFPGGFQLHGVIGFPVLEAMGELQFQNGILSIPKDPPIREIQNLALENLTPLIEFTYEGNPLIGRLDSGAGRSVFYEPFFRRFYSDKVSPSQVDTIKAGGVGGIVEHPIYWLDTITIGMADTTVMIDSIYVHTKVMGNPSQNHLYGNIGLDVLNKFDTYILNFEDMAFIVE
ncbi:hypothetical protein GWO43_29030 [candidate division KSB1 bacterium]|nr:hypothetical protein [candidate division KSB1 bacterium]NIR71569.1 hypothetical protein [candidate division KSB1 bacterium]NIS27951.1 hypothetical protein [candidate division KSB1 bacterium]NIT74832.1 hypothetical protein [candidate division KSB1 bacterium]NIU28608.1 hypothetical protein [candidate division KSB1 bacterium]